MKQKIVVRTSFALVMCCLSALVSSCSAPSESMSLRTAETFTEAQRLRPDPRMYGVTLDAQQVARYLALTGQGD